MKSNAVYEPSLCTFVLRFDLDTDLTFYEAWYKFTELYKVFGRY